MIEAQARPALVAAGIVALDKDGRLYELYRAGAVEVWRNSEGREIHEKFLTGFHKIS